jgi:GT2 family glycosyltransferase
VDALAPDGDGRPTVAVIIPVHNGGEAFRRCLESVRATSPPPDELIVVADGEGDGSAERAARHGDVAVVRLAERGGPARARNVGARHARSDILFFVDADVVVPATTVGRVAQVFRERPQVSAVIGSYDDAPAAANLLSQYKNLVHHYVHQNGREDGYTFWGACGAIRRGAFFEAGGFDEAYGEPSIEDIELGYRLRARGASIYLCKALQVKHLKRWGAVSLLRTDFFRRALPWTRLILRAGRLEDDLNIDRRSRAKVALVYGLAGALGLGCRWPVALPLAAAAAAALLGMDAGLLHFFREKRGPLFALATVPWQWFYYAYCGLAFAVGLVEYAFGAAAPRGAWGGADE